VEEQEEVKEPRRTKLHWPGLRTVLKPKLSSDGFKIASFWLEADELERLQVNGGVEES